MMQKVGQELCRIAAQFCADRAFSNVDQVFHIGPPENPGELAIGQAMIDLAAEFNIRQFVYNRHGLTGNSDVLELLLGRKPNALQNYLENVTRQSDAAS